MRHANEGGSGRADVRSSALDDRERLGWWCAVFLSSLLLTGLQLNTTAPFRLASLDRLIHFQAIEPFQCRVLVPAIAAALQHLAPLGTTLAFGLVELCFWMVLITLSYHALVRFRVADSELGCRALAFTVLAPMAVQLLVPEMHVASSISLADGLFNIGSWHRWPLFYYPYDLPAAVFILTLFLVLMRLRESIDRPGVMLFLAVFTVATINRETTIFMLPCTAALLWGRLSARRIVLLLAAMLALFLAVELPLYWLFNAQPNPNRRIDDTQYENHLLENLGLLESPFYAAWFITRFAGGFALLMLFWWRYLGRTLKIAAIAFVLPLTLSAFWVGRVPEHRIFIEAVPLVWLAALQALSTRLRRDEPDLPPEHSSD